MKKIISFGFVIVLLAFYGGYRLGLITDTRWTMEYMMNIKTFELADRAAETIIEFKEIKFGTKDNKVLSCKIRKSVMLKTDDWNTCKETKECAKKISKGFYTEVDEIISEFKAIKCE
jgi:hypothetical protein